MPWIALALAGGPAARAAGENYYEWIAVAPLVVTGESLGQDGKVTEIRVRDVIRGEAAPGQTLRVELRGANRDRDLELHRKPLRLEAGESYVLLLRPATDRKGRSAPAYELVRGVEGARPLPAEGAAALVRAISTFAEVQRSGDGEAWNRLRGMLSDTDPLVIATAIELHVKFRRGDVETLADVRPLLEHPDAAIRARAARLTGQIVERHAEGAISDPDRLRSELASRARRDPDPGVRIAATEALDRLRDDSVLAILDEIADDDPDQQVRYTAEALAYERRLTSSGPSH